MGWINSFTEWGKARLFCLHLWSFIVPLLIHSFELVNYSSISHFMMHAFRFEAAMAWHDENTDLLFLILPKNTVYVSLLCTMWCSYLWHMIKPYQKVHQFESFTSSTLTICKHCQFVFLRFLLYALSVMMANISFSSWYNNDTNPMPLSFSQKP